MTTPINFIVKCIEIERKVGDLYAEFARRFTHDAEVGVFFEDLAEEEYSHASALEMVKRVLRGFKGKVEVCEECDRAAEVIAGDLDRALGLLRDGKEINVATAIGLALKIEATMIENQGHGLLVTDSPELLKTFKILQDQTFDHKERLKAFLSARNG